MYESFEAQAKQQNITIRCLPSDDAFGKSVVLENYVRKSIQLFDYFLIVCIFKTFICKNRIFCGTDFSTALRFISVSAWAYIRVVSNCECPAIH